LTELEQLRRKIDEIDQELLNLISKRIEIAKKLGELKKSRELPVADYQREEQVVARGLRLADDLGLDKELTSLMLRALIGICRKAQSRLKVAFLGPRGSFSEEAALKAFLEEGAEFQPMPSISDVFRAAESGDIDYGVVPVENSIEGGVGETLDLLVDTSLKVCGEVTVKISLCLIARPGLRLQDVKIVLSHPHAIAQCRNFLNHVLKNVKIETCSSTAEAVRKAMKLDGAAAIGSRAAASLYGGAILASEIQDLKDDVTRFFILGRKRIEKAKGSKTSIIFKLPHTPGALYEALAPFAARRINLTRIESRPAKGRPWEYVFHVDFEGDGERDDSCIQALEELKEKVLFLKILGAYGEVGETIEQA